MSKESFRLSYLPQLDSFRFFAVSLVIISHWLPNNKINLFPNGFLGVTFFFVLSGFLISSNLLAAKRKMTDEKITFGQSIKTFYIRRTLRIFPLYFLVIFLILFFGPAMFRGDFTWYLTYTPNLLIFKTRFWPGMLSHFWSLGVEEQFYLIWPFVILLSPWSSLRYLFLVLVLSSVAFKFLFFKLSGSFFTFYDILPISCFDAFGIGALLAFYKKEMETSRFKWLVSGWALLIGIVSCFAIFRAGLAFLFGTVVSLTSAILIFHATISYRGIPGLVLNNRFLQYLGKISYGLYIYHNFMPWILRCLTGREITYPLPIRSINMAWLNSPVHAFFAELALLVIISSLSWYFFERPINNLKRYFVN